MMEYITNKDDRALNKLINADLVLLLPKNTEVFLLHSGITSTIFLHGMVKPTISDSFPKPSKLLPAISGIFA